jgi:signal transduction histidine kinase
MDRAMQGLEWEAIAHSRELHAMMGALETVTGVISGIGLVAPDGRMVAVASHFPMTPVDVSDREYFRAARAAPPGQRPSFVGEVVVSRPRDVPVFSLSRARHAEDGTFDGLIVTAFAPDYFSAFYTQIAESPRDAALLLRLDGALLARAPPVPDWTDRGGNSLLLPIAATAVAPTVTRTRSGVDGVERLYAIQRLDGYPVAVAYGLDASVLRAAWLRRVGILGGVCTLAAALLLGLTAHAAGAARRERAEAERRAEAEKARADAEAAMRGAQRLEALGQVAAGVAHDFRNTIHAVQSGARLAEQAIDHGDTERARALAAMMAEAAGRGAALTDRMLAMARGGAATDAAGPAMGLSDPAQAVRDTSALLRPALDAGIALRCVVADDAPSAVVGDRAGLEAAIINLAMNARDAMANQGVLRIAAEPGIAGAETDAPAELAPGRYVRIVVADSGVGMDAATLARATEAFFTTKPPGKGTGLGLATTRAFAARAGGALQIASSPGRGTTGTLWLPEAPRAA